MHRRFVLARRPDGLPTRDDFHFVESPPLPLEDGQLRVAVRFLSMDPAMRGWMNDYKSYVPAVQLGEVMRALGVGEVVESRHPDFAVGTWVSGMLGVQSECVMAGKGLQRLRPDLPPSAYLGPLGGPGLSAYFGLLDIGRPQAGETVLVSGAAGAVGSVVGQIAKRVGCRVVGIAGGPAKCAHLVQELGFDAAIDYKAEPLAEAVARECPSGVDVYFDNVGGEALEAALGAIALRGRVVLCGAISMYNATSRVAGPSNYINLLIQRGRMQGFIVFDYAQRYGEAIEEMAGWILAGELTYRETVAQGLETFPETFTRLFSGDKLGKLLLKV